MTYATVPGQVALCLKSKLGTPNPFELLQCGDKQGDSQQQLQQQPSERDDSQSAASSTWEDDDDETDSVGSSWSWSWSGDDDDDDDDGYRSDDANYRKEDGPSYRWEDFDGRIQCCHYLLGDMAAENLRDERLRYTEERQHERWEAEMAEMADEYVESMMLLEQDYDGSEVDVPITMRVSVSSYRSERKSRIFSKQSRQRKGEMRPGRMSSGRKQMSLRSVRAQDRSLKDQSPYSDQPLRDGLDDLLSFDMSGGQLDPWSYHQWFERFEMPSSVFSSPFRSVARRGRW